MRKQKTRKGFSIGEVLVAMFILLIGIVDAVFLTVRSVNDLGNSRDAVVATMLAQEGTELVRNVRDNSVTEDCSGERCTAFDSIYGFPTLDQVGGDWCAPDMNLGPGGTSAPGDVLNCGDGIENLYLDKTGDLFWTHSPGGDWFKGFRRRVYLEYDYTDSDGGTDSDGDGNINDIDEKYVDVTSVVVYSGGEFPDFAPQNIETTCLKSKNCAYAQTRLTSWINYGD